MRAPAQAARGPTSTALHTRGGMLVPADVRLFPSLHTRSPCHGGAWEPNSCPGLARMRACGLPGLPGRAATLSVAALGLLSQPDGLMERSGHAPLAEPAVNGC